MKKVTLYVGLNDQKYHVQTMDTSEATKVVTNLLLSNGINGATIFNAVGIYTHDDGTIITENTLRIELIEPEEDSLNNSISAIKAALNQESIIMSVTKERSALV